MRRVHFYDAVTGIFNGVSFSFSGPTRILHANTPKGCGAYEGEVDHLSQRFDLESGRLIDYVPPRPDADYDWNENTKRWARRAEAVNREQQLAAAMGRIAELEYRQLRAMRENALKPNEKDRDGKTAKDRIQAIDDEIAALRVQINV